MFRFVGMDEMLLVNQKFEEKGITSETYKKYIMGMLFYIFLSIKQEKFISDEFKNENMSFEEVYVDDDKKEIIQEKCSKKLGYFINPEDNFKSTVENIRNNEFSLEQFENILNNIISSFTFKYPNREDNVFNSFDFSGKVANISKKELNELINESLLEISENKALNYNLCSFIERVYTNIESNEKDYHFINTYHIKKVLYDLIRANGKSFDDVLDLTSDLDRIDDLLYPFGKIFTFDFEIGNLTCTCVDDYKYNLISMYPLMYELENNLKIKRELEFDDEKYDLILGNFSGYEFIPYKSNNTDNNSKDQNVFSCIEDCFLSLKEDGLMLFILPTDYIFNQNSTQYAIKYMKDNVLDAIINLPVLNTHAYSILIFKKDSKDTLLIDTNYLPNFKLPEKSYYDDEYSKFFYHPDIRRKFKQLKDSYTNRMELDNFSHIITDEELDNIATLKDYTIIHAKQEDLYTDELLNHRFPAPPWMMYPTIPLGSMGWRMGPGEHYLMLCKDYIDDIDLYHRLFPEPITWNWKHKGDEDLSDELKKFMKHSGGKYKFFTSNGRPTYTIDYDSVSEYAIINDTELDLKYEHTFEFATVTFVSAYDFMIEETNKGWGWNGKPLWNEIQYTLCLNANYSKIISDKKLIDQLLNTGDKVLIYYDESEYGVQKVDGKLVGENLQGLALMQIRDELRKVYENYDIIDWELSYYI